MLRENSEYIFLVFAEDGLHGAKEINLSGYTGTSIFPTQVTKCDIYTFGGLDIYIHSDLDVVNLGENVVISIENDVVSLKNYSHPQILNSEVIKACQLGVFNRLN